MTQLKRTILDDGKCIMSWSIKRKTFVFYQPNIGCHTFSSRIYISFVFVSFFLDPDTLATMLISFGIEEQWVINAAVNYCLNWEQNRETEKKLKMLQDEEFAKTLYQEDQKKQREQEVKGHTIRTVPSQCLLWSKRG